MTTSPATDRQKSYLLALSGEMKKLADEAVASGVIGHEKFVEAASAVVNALATHDRNGTLTKNDASTAIDYIISCNKKMRSTIAIARRAKLTHAAEEHESTELVSSPETIEPGMYRTAGGDIFKVQVAVHGSGRLYAKKLVPAGDPESDGTEWSFVYAPGAMRILTPSDRMTLEQAKEFGALYGTCCVCGRTLTNESSIEAGIGPVCAGKF